MFRFITLSASVVCVAFLGLGWAYSQIPLLRLGDPELEPERQAVTAQEAKLNGAIAALKQRQLELQKKNGYYARLNINGRLEVEKRRLEIESMDGTKHPGPFTEPTYFVAAGEHRYELSFIHYTDLIIQRAANNVGRTVLVSGELAPPRPPQTQVLEVRTFEIDPATEFTKIENANLVKGLTVKGEMKQVIGGFSSHGSPIVGDTFEINLEDLPQKGISLTNNKNHPSYIPFTTPLVIEEVKVGKGISKSGRTSIQLSAIDTKHDFQIRLIVDGELAKGTKVRMVFSMDKDDRYLGSMAEAEGVLE